MNLNDYYYEEFKFYIKHILSDHKLTASLTARMKELYNGYYYFEYSSSSNERSFRFRIFDSNDRLMVGWQGPNIIINEPLDIDYYSFIYEIVPTLELALGRALATDLDQDIH